jgi:hypothetical protein
MSSISEAEERMKSIEERLLSIESTSGAASNTAEVELALHQYQTQILGKLKEVRDKISEEGGDISTVRKERDEAVSQNVLLKKEVEKLNYRVEHLIKALNKAEALKK